MDGDGREMRRGPQRPNASCGLYWAQAKWLPSEVLGSAGYLDEPRWGKLQQMPIMEFHKGLRERNWTHPDYRPDAPKWKIHFFEDSGRFMRPSFVGYR